MANILVNVEKGIEIGAADVLNWLGKAHTALTAAPAVIAGLATLVTAVDKPLLELSGVIANPLNIALDVQTASDLKAVWPDVKTFLGTLGVKF
jgi:succinate dehydrogenase hydrophobic anchor subunit